MRRSRTTWIRSRTTGMSSPCREPAPQRVHQAPPFGQNTDFCRQLPYLVGNVVEILDLDVTAEAAEEGANIDLDATRVGKSAVIKTSTRQTIFLPLIGLVDHEKLKPGDLIGVNKDSYLVLDTLPAEYDSRVKAMEVDEKPTEKYTDVGGLDKQIEELVEAVVWPMKEAERFKKIGIKAPKGKQNARLPQNNG